MFQGRLNQRALLFSYSSVSRRLFHSFFCAPLRIIAFSGDAKVVFNKVVKSNRFVAIPRCQYIFELDANTAYDLDELRTALFQFAAGGMLVPDAGSWSEGVDLQQLISAFLEVPDVKGRLCWNRGASLDRLLWVLVADAVADMRKVYERFTNQSGLDHATRLSEHFTPYERGVLLSSAAYLQYTKDAIAVPEQTLRTAFEVIQAELGRGHMDELLAASMAGAPFEFSNTCLRCGDFGSWRQVLQAPEAMPIEVAWRYQRPENQVPICHMCAKTILASDRSRLIDMARGIWGMRFEALLRWHEAWLTETLPSVWNKEAYPLWPKGYEGDSWETGSGAVEHSDPLPPVGVVRTPEHQSSLIAALSSQRMRFDRDPSPLPLARLEQYQIQGVYAS